MTWVSGSKTRLISMLCGVLFAVLVPVTAPFAESSSAVRPEIVDGTLDLSNWSLLTDGSVSLDGEWIFGWEQSLPDVFEWTELQSLFAQRFRVPARWEGSPHPVKEGERLGRFGYATYALRVMLPPYDRERQLEFSSLMLAARVGVHHVVGEGQLRSSFQRAGTFTTGTDEPSTNNAYRRLRFPIPASTKATELIITVELSNHATAFLSGGIFSRPRLHDSNDEYQARIRRWGGYLFSLGVCFIIGLYHLTVFILRRKNLPALYFGMFCLAYVGNILAGNLAEFWAELGLFQGGEGWLRIIRLQLVVLPGFAIAGPAFVNSLLPSNWLTKIARYWGVGLGAPLALFALVGPDEWITPSYTAFHIHLVGSMAGTLVHVAIQSWRGDRLARWVLAAFLVVFITGFHDLLMAQGYLSGSMFISTYGFLVFIAMQSVLLAKVFAEAQIKATHLAENLAEEVEAQTLELKHKTAEAMEAKEYAELSSQEALRQKAKAETARLDAEDLRQAAETHAEELKALDKQKTAFFQNMSHELRTPLTLILGPLENAVNANRADEDIVVATKNARRLLRLVNQLLDFQKMEAGKKEFALEPVNINRFTYVLGDYFASACSSKAIDFHVTRNGTRLDPEQVVPIMGETDSLEKIAFNFLSNALKYTPRGGRIELGLETPHEGDAAKLYVQDSGPGISEEGKKALFQVFSQVEGGTTREYEGTGLGLALAKSLVEKMGGHVGVESTLGEGSRFFATFPVLDGDFDAMDDTAQFKARTWMLEDAGETGVETDVEEEGTEDQGTEGRGQLVLVVDDLPDMRNLIGSALKKRGYRVLKAANGAQGYDVICERTPDLVISDWMMPKMTGPDMLAKMRQNPKVSGTPFVLLTAKSDQESKVIGTEIGADVFLGKPFNDQELGSAVRNLLGLKTREKEVEKLNAYITESVMKRYLPPTLISEILEGNLSMDKPAELRNITVLFSDLKGFTSTSASLGPEGISKILNEYLTEMNKVIFEFGGTIDKFIGDAVMVLFGAPQDMSPKDQVERATRCGLAMNEALDRLAMSWTDERAIALKMRIGIHHGPAVVGNFGSEQRSDYTAIGPTVNFAARIESASEAGSVFVSEQVATLLEEDRIEEVGAFDLKGIDGEQTLYRVVDD